MLKKLIAYDFQCQWKLAIGMFATSLICAVFSSICFQSLFSLAGSFDGDGLFRTLLILGLTLGFILLLILSMVAAAAVIFAVGIHYYKKFVSDEAYLTFTLPATPGQHLTAKLISGGTWMLLSTLLIVVNLIIVIVPMYMRFYSAIQDDYVAQASGLTQIMSVSGIQFESIVAVILYWGGSLLLALVSVVSQISLLYLSLTVGGVLAQKHKAIAGVGIYIAADSIIGGVISTITAMLEFGGFFAAEAGAEFAVAVVPYLNTVVFAVFSAAFILFNKHLLTKKLNLA